MNFISYEFFALLGVVLALYGVLSRRGQNLLLLVASYFFYGWWDWRFLALLMFSTVLDYSIGRLLATNRISDDRKLRRALLTSSIAANLGLLAVFKYYDFFVESLASSFAAVGIQWSPGLLEVVLPVGISFYTFQTMSYTIDVYRGRAKPANSLLDFAVYVSFFPQLVAGPIERAANILPQLAERRVLSLDRLNSGFALVLVGLFKKTVLADNVALLVDPLFSDTGMSVGAAIVGSFGFALQIYCDFSAYTDIARGTGRMLGISLMENFRRPYFAASPSEFWQRWHISLSTWLRDYLYIPLGGNRKGRVRTCINLGLTMLLGGLWHGAHLKFVLWGVYHGALLIVFRTLRLDSIVNHASFLRRLPFVMSFFVLTCFGWFLFRAQGGQQIVNVLMSIVALNIEIQPYLGIAALIALLALPIFIVQVLQERKGAQEIWLAWPISAQFGFYFLITALMLLVGAPKTNAFIYFQF